MLSICVETSVTLQASTMTMALVIAPTGSLGRLRRREAAEGQATGGSRYWFLGAHRSSAIGTK
jgi:hypothetical protein